MEKYTMFIDSKNKYSENEYTTQSNICIQCNPYQATNGIFHGARTNNFTICMENLFPAFHFQSVCVPFWGGSLVDNICRGLVFVSIQPVFVFWLGAFNPFTFKVITDKNDPIAIYFVLGSSLYTVFVFPV